MKVFFVFPFGEFIIAYPMWNGVDGNAAKVS